jgi:hypothetical protein
VPGRWRPWLLALLVLPGMSFAELRAQTCTLPAAPPPNPVYAVSATSFLPAGRDGEIVVRRKAQDSTIVSVFATSDPQAGPWKVLSQPPVISVRAPPEKTYDGFLPGDSSVVRFIVPAHAESLWDSLWPMRTSSCVFASRPRSTAERSPSRAPA